MSAEKKHDKTENHAVNLLKFFFILGIVLFHEHEAFKNPYSNIFKFAYAEGGDFGTLFFFGVSGFFMSKNYYERITCDNGISFKEFVLRRLASIYPLFFISNIIQLGLELRLGNTMIFDVSKFFLSLFLVTGIGGRSMPPNFPTWFISDLFICYLLFYCIVKLSKNRTSYRTMVVIMVLIAYFCRVGVITIIPLMGSNQMNFFFGCVIAEVTQSKGLLKNMFYYLELSFAAVGIVLACFYGIDSVISDRGVFYSFIITSSLILISDLTLIKELCDNRFIRHIGKLSTPVFFWHAPVFTLFYGLYVRMIGEMNGKWALPVYILMVMVVSEISNLIFPKINKWFYTVLSNDSRIKKEKD